MPEVDGGERRRTVLGGKKKKVFFAETAIYYPAMVARPNAVLLMERLLVSVFFQDRMARTIRQTGPGRVVRVSVARLPHPVHVGRRLRQRHRRLGAGDGGRPAE